MSEEDLALCLAVQTEVAYPPQTRAEAQEIWDEKTPSVQVAYKLRAKRLLAMLKRPL